LERRIAHQATAADAVQQLLPRHVLQFVELIRFDPELGQHGFGGFIRGLNGYTAQRRPAFNHRAVEQPLRGGHGQQRAYFGTAAGLAEDGDIVRIAAEPGNVIAHPFERLDDVQHPDIAGVGVLRAADSRQVQIAEDVEPVIDRHDHDVVACGQIGAVINRKAARAGGKAAAMQPEHHRAFVSGAEARGPDVQVQTILAHGLFAVDRVHFGNQAGRILG